MSESIAADTGMGAVTLRVADLDAMTAYYRDAVGLDVLREDLSSMVLGRGEQEVVILQHAPELRHAGRHEAGLYHTAILFDTPAALAASVYSVARRHPGSFTGSSDHFVSEAFYFDDPEGNGVELYWDRDRSQWRWHDGIVDMGVVRLDPNAYLEEHLTEAGAAEPRIGGARVGHVHLQVGDIQTATDFYVGIVGFDLTAHLGAQAAFASAGGYHHHIGMNTWHSAGAGRRSAGLGLGRVEIALPDTDARGALAERLAARGVATRDDGHTIAFDDPWGTEIVATAP
ncbi:MAG TPA: VOC family protein [Microbacteriaceae bacterium]|nr:VOC family protein [Microbacteriaceae bacterium]